ncbi:fungal-specific transcription factor domain-containing protein [Crepidotus variabilis]|uniref:Fungal-specific transcription factor domain-containing protein n=1 Tax=Crepidotus variabilis TaxID=179855 RepID=A0A9P6E528_9AGAR|nr:fungal-specific transcription factor domain-containing protein [Crepidotus variabilis]
MASYGSNEMQQQNGSSSSLVVRHPKRRGVALSCAECRRLKLKCSRVFPCSNCVKKGCGAICPEASLTTGKGNRFVLANTQELHEKISVLANRVRQLEDGLAQSHSLNSSTPHPLLSEDLLQIKRPLERERQDAPSHEDDKPEAEDAIDSLGSLSLSTDGRASFFGQAASSWHLLQQNEEGSDNEEASPLSRNNGVKMLASYPGTTDITSLSHGFPFATTIGASADGVRQSILGSLPTAYAAKDLIMTYYRHAAWLYHPIKRPDLEQIYLQIYDPELSSSGPRPNVMIHSHSLAVLCMVLALGALVDLSKPKMSSESNQYFQLGRAALSLDSVLEEHSIHAIQALVLMSHFMFFGEMSNDRWVTLGMVVKLAQSIGLHRDIRKWRVDSEQSEQLEQRRDLFHEIFTFDAWQALTFGRPPSFSTAHVDVQMPQDTIKDEHGEIEMTYDVWKYRFSSQCLSVVIDRAFGARPPNYKLIQDLDAKVRNWYIPPSLRVPGFGRGNNVSAAPTGESEKPSVQLTMQRYVAYAIREMTLFYMHRGFFAQAMEDSPTDPMGSKYAPSVLAAYNCATSFVSLIDSLFNQHPQLTERMWFLLTHVFSCAIVLGSIATKSRMGLARSALSHLELAYNLFTRTSDTAKRSKVLPVLSKLRERARSALSTVLATNHTPDVANDRVNNASYFAPKIKSEVDELSALGGLTRLVSRRTSSSSSPSASAPSPQSQASPSPTPLYQPPPNMNSRAIIPASMASSSSSPSMEHQQQMYHSTSSTVVSHNSSNSAPAEASPTSSWSTQNYTHIQNFNVSINMAMGGIDSPGEYYSNGHTPTTATPTDVNGYRNGYSSSDGGMLYSTPQEHESSVARHHQHPQSQTLHSSQRQYPPVQSSNTSSSSTAQNGMMPIEMTTDPFYAMSNGYSGNISPSGGYGQIYNPGQTPMVLSPPEMPNSTLQDSIHDPWHSFMARYQS